MGIDPITHKPRTNALVGSAEGRSQEDGVNANLNHIAQWESARVEAEARLVKESKLLSSKYLHNLHPHNNHNHNDNHNHPPIPFPPSKQPMLPCLDILKAWQGVVWTNHTNNNHAGTLESPTSVLHVSDNVLISSARGATNSSTITTFFSSSATSSLGLNNFRPTDVMTKKNYSDPQNNEHDVMLLHGIINDGSFPIDALSPCIPGATAGMCDDNDLLPSFPEEVLVTADDHDLLLSDDVAGIFSGMTGIYVDGSSSSSGGNLEDNNKYWNY